MTGLLFEMTFAAEADVVKNDHGVECVAVHPAEQCDGEHLKENE